MHAIFTYINSHEFSNITQRTLNHTSSSFKSFKLVTNNILNQIFTKHLRLNVVFFYLMLNCCCFSLEQGKMRWYIQSVAKRMALPANQIRCSQSVAILSTRPRSKKRVYGTQFKILRWTLTTPKTVSAGIYQRFQVLFIYEHAKLINNFTLSSYCNPCHFIIEISGKST